MDTATPAHSVSSRFIGMRHGGRPGRDAIALVLQGGGSLGAYQAGAYQLLA